MTNVILGLFLLGCVAYFMIGAQTATPPVDEKMRASSRIDSGGDGSAVQNAPSPAVENICDCHWENGIVSGTPYSEDKVNGICYFVNKGQPVFGNLDTSRKICTSVLDGKPVSAVSYLYLTGSGCAPNFKPRQYCGPTPPTEATGGVCVTKDGRYGHTTMKNGMWTCSTSNGVRTNDVCSGFSYETLDGVVCKIPQIG